MFDVARCVPDDANLLVSYMFLVDELSLSLADPDARSVRTVLLLLHVLCKRGYPDDDNGRGVRSAARTTARIDRSVVGMYHGYVRGKALRLTPRNVPAHHSHVETHPVELRRWVGL